MSNAYKKLNRSLRRHNKRNHVGYNGVLHMGNGFAITSAESSKIKLIDDKPEQFKVSINEIFAH